MSEHAPDHVLSGIDIPKTIAGVLAAVSAAVLGSFLGVAGTLAGAAIASVVGSVGTEIYRKFIDRGHKKIVATFVTAPAAVGTPAVAAAGDESPSQPEPEDAPAAAPARMRWGRVATVAAGIFLLAIAALTSFELITGKSAADATGHHTGSTTTIGSLFGGSGNKKTGQVTTPASTAPSKAPTTGGTQAPATTTPTTTATTGSTPSAAPTQTTAPEPTATDTQNSGNGAGQNDEVPPATHGTE
jgi:hypothetical protein